MEQSVTRVSRGGRIAKVAVAALIGLAGLTVVGVGPAAAAAPNITSLSPVSGPADGGTSVIINGGGFGSLTATPPPVVTVTFGGVPAAFVQKSGIRIVATAPPAQSAATVVDVVVTSNGVASSISSADQYTYAANTAAPTVTAVSPVSAAAGATVAVTGTNFGGATAVDFGSTPATSYTVDSGTSISAVAPAGAGLTDITVTTAAGTSAVSSADGFTFIATPTVTGLRTVASPAGGPTGGGTQVTIDGTSFTSDATVKFGSTPATGVVVNSLYSITAVAPAGTGTADVTVTTALGTSATSSADTYTYNSTLAVAPGTAGYGSGTSTATPVAITGTSQSGSTVTITTPGVWTPGEEVYLTGFLLGPATNFYTVTVGGTGSFGITATTTGSSSGTMIPTQIDSFNAASLVTGGGTVDPSTLTVVSQPASGTASAAGGQLLYMPDRVAPTSSGVPAVWTQDVTTTGTQTVTFAICESGHTWSGNPSAGCAEGTVDYVPAGTGYYMGQQISALGGSLKVSVVVDTSGAVVVPASAATGSTFTSITAPPMSLLPSANSGFTVENVGGYQAITPVPAGVSLVPGSLHVSGGDTATSGKYIASYCTAAMGYVPGECTANFTGNYHATYPYIETSLNAATTVPGGTEITLPTVTAQWQVTAPSGSISSYETEFTVATLVSTVGQTNVDAYPSDLYSYNNQGSASGTPVPVYAAPAARWTVAVAAAGPSAPSITSADATTFTAGSPGTFQVTASGSPAPTFSETGALPSGVTLNSNGVLSGTPAAGTGGSYPITITATNGTAPDATQSFTLTVKEAPFIISGPSVTFTAGTAGSFAVTATGYPTPTYSETGALPTGVTLDATTGALSGTPAAGTGGSYALTLTATNGVSPDATQNFVLTVDQAPLIASAAATTFTVGTAGAFGMAASGYPAPSFSETGTLPSGVTLDPTTGLLSGTPAPGTGGSYPVTITATNGVSPDATQNFVLTVDQAPGITSAATADFTIGSSGTFQVTATGNPAPTYSETGALPAGVTLNATTGVLSGTPIITDVAGNYNIVITATNGHSPDATQNFILVLSATPTAPTITSTGSTTFTVGSPGTFAVTASGNPTPTFAETGALPSGVTLDATTGVLSGTPAAGTGGSYAITITATNGVIPAGTQNFTLVVDQAPSISSGGSTTFTVGTAGTFTVTATGYPAPTYSETGALPSGVTLDATTGVLSGTPAAGTGGSYPVTLTATNGIAPDATQSFVLTVDQAPAITGLSGTVFTVGSPTGTLTASATGYPAPTFSESGTLPSGVTLDATTGVLSGTPAAGTGGSYPVTLTATNGTSPDATQNFTLTVDQAPVITSAPSTTFTMGSAGTFTVTATGTPAPTYSEAGALPSGVTLDGATGVLSGTPSQAGTFTVTVTATNGVGTDATQTFTLSVAGPPVPPTIDHVTTGDGTATVTWTPGPDDGSPITSYTATATPVLGPTALHLVAPSCTVPAPATSCTITGLANGTTYTFTVTATNGFGPSIPSTPSSPVVPTSNGAIQGYWTVTSAGAVLTNGAAVSYGSAAGLALTKPIVGMAPTPDRKGYWLVASDGGVFSYGDASFYGSTGGMHLNAPIVGMASTTDGRGYWLVASDGGVFAYGDAAFAGSMGGTHLNAPIVGMTGDGSTGYLLVASDGGVFAFGGAPFHGSAGSVHLASPVVGIAAVADGSGYWLVASDGGVFAYGSAPFAGSAAGSAGSAVVGITAGAGGGYTLATSTGGIYSYGTTSYGDHGSGHTTAPFVGIAS